MKLVIGLGNVGKRYANTRHNIGFMVVEELARQLATDVGSVNSQIYGRRFTDWKTDAKLQADIAKIELESDEIVFAKPVTMMNNSGEAVQRLMQKYRLKPGDVWVIYDDVDVPFGRLRLRTGATSGQQGIRSITLTIGSNFVHLRMGISLNDRAVEPSEVYVLKPFTASEITHLPEVISKAAQVISEQLRLEAPVDTTFDLLGL